MGAVPGFMGAFVLLDGASKGRREGGRPGEKKTVFPKAIHRFVREQLINAIPRRAQGTCGHCLHILTLV